MTTVTTKQYQPTEQKLTEAKVIIYTFGPMVTLTASASSSTPLSIKARPSTPNLMSLAA